MPLSQPAFELVLAAVLALAPVAVLLDARRRATRPRPPAAFQLVTLYAIVFLLLAVAALLEGPPAALALAGLLLAVLGLGMGVNSIYRYLYGPSWLAEHGDAVHRDIDRWQRLALILAVSALTVAVIWAFMAADVAHAP